MRVLVQMALRSLWSHKIKSLIVGSIMFFGTLLVVLGTALLDSVETGMRRSITQSLSGHLQVYAADAKDELAIFGGMGMGDADIGELPDFSVIKKVIEAVPNVRAVVPMGIHVATMSRGSELERTLGRVRDALRKNDEATAKSKIPKLKRLLGRLLDEVKTGRTIAADAEDFADRQKRVEESLSEAFWMRFEGNPQGALEFLDTKVAPLAGDGLTMYLRYVGTDIPAFAEHFDRFTVVRGTSVPAGQRGILINQKFADVQLKLKAARLLDSVRDGLKEGKTIAADAALKAKARQAASQFGSVSLMLDPEQAAELEPKLKALLPGVEGDLDALLKALLTVDDANFAKHFAFFYETVGPLIELYPFEIGDVVTIRTFTKTGYVKAMNVKVWGTFAFKGLERSELTGAANLLDLLTFRDLYGQMSPEALAELKAIKEEVGTKHIKREDAEAALFGGGEMAATEAAEPTTDFGELSIAKRGRRSLDAKPFTQAELEGGLALNAAILLEDADKLEETQKAIEAATAKAGLKLKVVDWQKASGMLGQFVTMVRAVLYVAIFIIFGVALVIINNSMLMATMERVKEIGTLRAIGAQRRFVMAMFLIETIVLGLLSGGLGALVGAGIVTWMGAVGIPAASEILVFLFSGPRLHPVVTLSHLLTGVGVILVVSLISTWYPARIATRIQPIEAMGHH